ncbi:hypothetical protein [Endozoicomonas sp. ALB032]|uniref:hypothetical protein n=1 Tax=Endozoicomonas sp. ALB032 TaxID=3403082 RepID=UPI003BB55D3E
MYQEYNDRNVKHWVDLKKQTSVLEKIVYCKQKRKYSSTLDNLGAFSRKADKHLKYSGLRKSYPVLSAPATYCRTIFERFFKAKSCLTMH